MLRLIQEFMIALQKMLEKKEIETKQQTLKKLYQQFVGDATFYRLEPIEEILKALKKIVDKHHTNLKLVLTPGLNQDYMNDKDFAILQQTLGKENVFSYELNVHKELNKIENFHDGEHFRRRLARYILNDIYGKMKE